jgi:small-conductance mechanosensitive channel
VTDAMPANAAAAHGADTHGLESKDALAALLTVETLLFAAFALAAAFLVKREEGWDLPTSAGKFGWFVAGAIGVVALGAAVSWGDVYIRCQLSPAQVVSGVCLAVGIVSIAAMSVWVAIAVQRNA